LQETTQCWIPLMLVSFAISGCQTTDGAALHMRRGGWRLRQHNAYLRTHRPTASASAGHFSPSATPTEQISETSTSLSLHATVCLPVTARRPAVPAGPGSPWSPFAPIGPWGPTGPCKPCSPFAPGGPATPCGPCGPRLHPRSTMHESNIDTSEKRFTVIPLAS
jgi:hypothetical protein